MDIVFILPSFGLKHFAFCHYAYGMLPSVYGMEPSVYGMEPGALVFLRLNVHKRGAPSLFRGQQGTIVRHDARGAVVDFTTGTFVVLLEWLEPHPGTFSKGFAAVTSITNGIYLAGMMCSDIKLPKIGQAQYQRYWEHLNFLADTGCGASFYEGINALSILESFHEMYPEGATQYLRNVGLIVCEHIWPSGRGNRTEFLLRVVRSLESQMTSIPKIVLLRRSDVDLMRHELEPRRRIVTLDGPDLRSHYTPLRMHWDAPSINPIFAAETAIYIKPISAAGHVVNRPLHVPTEVLSHMFKGKQTLFLAAGTLDSPVACTQYLLEQLRLHNIRPPSRGRG